jgi:hypothetical protein
MATTTPTTIEALEGAIEMLSNISKGGSYNTVDYYQRLWSYERARDEHRRLEMIDERNRAAIRAAGAELRTRKATSCPVCEDSACETKSQECGRSA